MPDYKLVSRIKDYQNQGLITEMSLKVLKD